MWVTLYVKIIQFRKSSELYRCNKLCMKYVWTKFLYFLPWSVSRFWLLKSCRMQEYKMYYALFKVSETLNLQRIQWYTKMLEVPLLLRLLPEVFKFRKLEDIEEFFSYKLSEFFTIDYHFVVILYYPNPTKSNIILLNFVSNPSPSFI